MQQYGSGPKIGDIKYVDITSQVDGKNIVNDNDKHVIGSPTVPESPMDSVEPYVIKN